MLVLHFQVYSIPFPSKTFCLFNSSCANGMEI